MTAPGPEIRQCRSRDELVAVVDLCDRAFEKTPRSYFERHVLNDATLRPEDTLILMNGGNIVSSIQIFPRRMRVGNENVPFGGIGNVATDPEARRFGFASLLMQRAMEEIRQRGWPLALLSTSINPYYERFGFRTIVRDCIQVDGFPGISTAGVRAFDRECDLPAIQEVYDEYNAGAIGPVDRDREYWEAQLGFCDEQKDMFLVIGTPGSLSAYIRAGVHRGELRVMEFGGRGDVPGQFESLAAAVAAREPGLPPRIHLSRRERERIALRLPHTVLRDTEMMLAIRGEPWRTRLEEPVFRGKEFQYWRTDFF